MSDDNCGFSQLLNYLILHALVYWRGEGAFIYTFPHSAGIWVAFSTTLAVVAFATFSSQSDTASSLEIFLNKAFHSWVPVKRVTDPVVWSRQSVRLCCQHNTGDKDESDSQLEHGVI